MAKLKQNKNLGKIIIIGLLAAGLFSFGGTAYAADYGQEDLKSLLQNITEKAREISVIMDNPDLTKEEKEVRETLARKEVLSLVFDLTLLEDKDLKDKLNSLNNLNNGEEASRESLLVVFTENENAYSEMRKRLADAETLEEIKQLASDFKNWRNAVYNPKVEKIVSFILIFRQKDILEIAWQRLEKIKVDLKKLENADLMKPRETQEFLQAAISNLEAAEELNRAAEMRLISIINNELVPGSSESPLLTPRELIEKSLDNIKSAYGNFIEIGKLVKEKLGF